MGNQKKSGKQSTGEQKLEAVREVLEKNRHKQDVANEMDVHINSLTNWLRIYREKGPEGLLPPARQTNTLPPAEELERLREIEKKYNEQLEEIEILKKFQAFLKENG